MNCKHCGFSTTDDLPLCPHCGQWTIQAVPALPAPKKMHSRLPYILLLAMLLVGTLLFFLIPSGGTAAQNELSTPQNAVSNDKILLQKDCFVLTDGVLYFHKTRFIPNQILIVPSAIDQVPVTVISADCFFGLEGVSTIMLPSTITKIDDGAFRSCTDLQGIEIPASVQNIGKNAFRDCTNLEAISVPGSVHSIGANAFENCPTLRFIFFDGQYEQWCSLYPQSITPFTWIICQDGEYRQTP